MRWLAAVAVLAACHRAAPRVVVEVAVAWPGSTPEVMASSVATPIERALGQVPHAVALTSVSREGMTVVRVEVEGDRDRALTDVRNAMQLTLPELPVSLPTVPQISAPGPIVGRYLVAADNAERAVIELEHGNGVLGVDTCGLAERREQIVVDAAALAAAGLTLGDVRHAVTTANVNVPAGNIDGARRDYTLATGDSDGLAGSLVIALRNGAPVRLSDVARSEDGFAPMACALAPRGMVELDVHAMRRDAVTLRLDVVTDRPELHGELDPAMKPEAALARIADAIGTDATRADHRSEDGLVLGAVAEIRGSELVVHGASPVVVDRLRRTVGVVTLGEHTATVHVSGADPHAVAEAARAIADRLRTADQLVATHGLVTVPSQHIEVDRPAAARLDLSMEQIDDTLAASYGGVVSTIFTQNEQLRVVMRADDPSHLYLHGADGTLVPLSSVVRITETAAPLEILHRSQFPDVDLEVHGDPRSAIGSVPAGIRVDVD